MSEKKFILPPIDEIYKMIEKSLEEDSMRTPEELERLRKASKEVYDKSIMQMHTSDESGGEWDDGESLLKKKVGRFNKFEDEEDEESKSEPLAPLDSMEIINMNLKKFNEFDEKFGVDHKEKLLPVEYRCAYCNHVYPGKKMLEEHNKKRCVNEYRCRKCNKVFSKKGHFDDHMKMKKSCVATAEDIHICKLCGKAYTTSGNLRVHIKSCKLKKEEENKKAKKDELKVREIENYIKEYNNRDNKGLSNFRISESITKDVRGGFSIPELGIIAKYLEDKKFSKLVEFVINKMHYSDDYKKCQNIRYISQLDKYILYDGQWLSKSEKNVLNILFTEVKFAMYLARDASDIPGNKTLSKILFENDQLFDEYMFLKTQNSAVKNVQKKYEELEN